MTKLPAPAVEPAVMVKLQESATRSADERLPVTFLASSHEIV